METVELFLTLLGTPNTTPNEIDKVSKDVVTQYANNKEKLCFDIQKIAISTSKWIKSNFNSKLLPFAFRLIINLYEALGFQLEFDVQDYYKTSDKLDERDPKALGKSDLEGFEDDKDLLIENPLLSSEVIQIALSLIENLVAQRKHISHKSLLTLILPIIAIYSTDKKVQNLIRKKKFLKLLLKLFKDTLESTQKLTEVDIQICSYLLHTTAKLTFHNKKNQDYLIKKKGYEYIKGVIATSQDLILLQGAICTFANLSETNDGCLVLWCSGNLPFISQRIKVSLNNLRKYLDITKRKASTFQHALRDLELCLIGLWKLSAKSEEVIEDCFKSKDLVKNIEEIYGLMEIITNEDPNYLNYIKSLSLCVALVRRFCLSPNYKKQTLDQFMKFICKIPKIYNDEINEAALTHSFMLKEYAALIGVVCLEKDIIDNLVEHNIIGDIIKIGISYFDNPKLVKTVLGFLININAFESIREQLSRDKYVYVLLYNVLDKYDYSNLIIDYELKLVLNTSQNGLFFRNYTSARFLEKFIYIFHIYLEDDMIFANSIKLFRVLTSRSLGVEGLVAAVSSYESNMQGKFDFISALVENVRINDYQITVEIIMLISVLSQNSAYSKTKIQGNKLITAFVNTFINNYKDKPEVFKLVSNSLACLPLEEIGLF